MGGFVFEVPRNNEVFTAKESPSKPSTNTHNIREIPAPSAFIYIMKHFPNIIPDIPEESITDRAESNSLSKALLFVQIGWFCTNCASRVIQRLPLSLLEVSTAAHSLSTLLTYLIWWSKPLSIAEGTIMSGKETQEVHALLMCSEGEYHEALRMAETMAAGESLMAANNEEGRLVLAANALRHLLPNPERPPTRPFRNHFELWIPGSFPPQLFPDRFYEWIVIAISPILYGLVHFLAWSGHFPTSLERLLWRVSSVVVTCSGFVAFSSGFTTKYIFKLVDNRWKMFLLPIPLMLLCMVPLSYMLSSGFLIVESLRQLFYLDPAAYELVSWSNYWPHFS